MLGFHNINPELTGFYKGPGGTVAADVCFNLRVPGNVDGYHYVTAIMDRKANEWTFDPGLDGRDLRLSILAAHYLNAKAEGRI